MAQNTSSGQVARANVLGSAGESGARIADILGQYENQNVGISNTASAAQAQIHNQQTDRNTEYLNKFVGETATVNQQYNNAMAAKKYRKVDAYNQGTTNAMHQTQLEQSIPQVRVDRMNGRMSFSGNAKDGLFDGKGGSSQTPSELLDTHVAYHKQAYDKAIAHGMDPERATKFADRELGLYEPTDPKSKLTAAQKMQQQLANHKYGGEVLPAMPGW